MKESNGRHHRRRNIPIRNQEVSWQRSGCGDRTDRNKHIAQDKKKKRLNNYRQPAYCQPPQGEVLPGDVRSHYK